MLARALGRRFVFVSALEHIGASFEPKRATKGVKPKRKLRILEGARPAKCVAKIRWTRTLDQQSNY